MPEDVTDLFGVEPEVYRDEGAPEHADAEQAHEEARRVGRDDGDAVVLRDAKIVEGGAQAPRHLGELGVGEAAETAARRIRLVDHRLAIAVDELGALEKISKSQRNDHGRCFLRDGV